MDDEILIETRYVLQISIDDTVTPPSPPLSAGIGDRFFSVYAEATHVEANCVLPPNNQIRVSPSRCHVAVIPRYEFLSLGAEAVRTLFAPHLGLPTDLTDYDVARFERDISDFAEEAVSRDSGAAVVPVQMSLTAITLPEPEDFDFFLELWEVVAEAVSGPSLTNDDDLFRTVPASESSMEALAEVEAVDDDNDQGQCTICWEDLFAGDHDRTTAAKMPCSHLFHRQCIVQWLETSHFCPLCRYAMPTSSPD